ncbi:MAG TPA: serine/threonine-protein kinase [Phycisphaerae bacterium]
MLLDGYKIVELLGKGAHSEIYEVVRIRTGERFAVKQVIRNSRDDDRFIEQTLTDFAVSHAVRHPNLRASYEMHRKRPWFRVREVLLLMEFVPGQTLEAARPQDWQTITAIFAQVIEGLEALHAAGYIHADMKPNNIIVTSQSAVKIIDFGQSCRIGTRKERVQGTPDFIAPEQVARRTLDQRTDVFNFGATMYWTLTGKTYPTDQRLLGEVRGHDITDPDLTDPPHVLNASVPAGLSKLVMDCCRQSPGERPPDMRQVRGRLVALQKLQKSAVERSGGRQTPAGEGGAPRPAGRTRDGTATQIEPFDGRDFE